MTLSGPFSSIRKFLSIVLKEPITVNNCVQIEQYCDQEKSVECPFNYVTLK